MMIMSIELKNGKFIFDINKINILPKNKFELLFEDDEEENQIIDINDVKSITML
jgi:hypothetical protein